MSTHVKDLLENVFSTHDDWKIKLLKNWSSILGEINTKVRLEKIYNDTLILAVNDACWLQELYLLTPILLTKINQTLDVPRIKQLRFKQAGTQKQKKDIKAAQGKKYRPLVLTMREQKALEKVPDAELSSVLKQFLARCRNE